MSDRTLRVRLEALTSDYAAKLRQASQTTRTEGQAMMGVVNQNAAAFTGLGIAVGAAGAAITFGLKNAANANAEFQSALTKSTTLIGISSDEMQKMGDQALRLSDTGQGPMALADALFFAQSAGLRGAAAMEVVEAAAKAASIGLGDTATITDLVTSAVNAYGSEALSASQATDVLIGTVREGKAEATELAASMGRVLPIASNMGVSLDQVGAAMAAMTRTGTNAAESATQLRAIMVSLLKPAEQSEAALAEFGLSASGLRKTIREDGLWAALTQLKTAIGDNEEAMAQIFPNVRALAGVLDLTGESADATGQIFDNMTDTIGLTDEGFAEWSKTTEASQKRFSAAMEAAKISLGETLQPAMRAVLDTGTGLAQTFTDLPGPMKSVVGIGGGVAGVAATLAGAFLIAAPRIQATRLALTELASVAPRTVGALRGVSSVIFGPWGLAMAGAATALFIFAQRKAEQNRRIEEVAATLDKETQAITENTNQWIINEARRRNLDDHARALGVRFGDVALAIQGNAEAQERLNRAVQIASTTTGAIAVAERTGAKYEDVRDAARRLRLEVEGLGFELEAGTEVSRENAEATAELEGRYLDFAHALKVEGEPHLAEMALLHQGGAGAARDHADATDETTSATERYAEAQQDATQKLTDYLDRVRAMTDPVFRLERAVAKAAEAQEKQNAAIAKHGPNSDEAREATFELLSTVLELEAAALEAGGSFGHFERKLDDMVHKGKITEEQARILKDAIRELTGVSEDFTGDYHAGFFVDTSEALRKLRELQTEWLKLRDMVGSDDLRFRAGPGDLQVRPESGADSGQIFSESDFPQGLPQGGLVQPSQNTTSTTTNTTTSNTTVVVNGDPDPRTVFKARDLVGIV